MESSSEDEGKKGSGVVDAVTGLLAGGGVAVARTTGQVVGYTGKFLRIVKDSTTSLSLPSMSSLPGVGLFTGGVLKRWGGERATIKVKIARAQQKIEKLYKEIGKRGAGLSGVEDITQHESVKELVNEVKSIEGHIKQWEDRLKNLDKERAAERARRDVQTGPAHEIKNRIKEEITKAKKTAVFENSSEKAIFDKVTHDLLDDDVEIKLLAAAELGKSPNKASIQILKEALGYGDVYLSSEIINALININDQACLPVFKENANDNNFRIRLGCLRGLYKIAATDSVPYLVDGLKDEHKEVRKSAATFLGWIGVKDAAPALTQALKDSDQEVKNAAAMALSILGDPSSIMPLIRTLGESSIEVREKIVHAIERITGKSVDFKIDASGDELRKNVEKLKNWWQKNKLADVDEALEEEEAASGEPAIDDEETEEEAPAEEPVAEEGAPAEETKSEEAPEGPKAEEVSEGPAQEEKLSKDDLQKMLKKDLSGKCDEMGVKYSDDDTKSDLIKKILKESKKK